MTVPTPPSVPMLFVELTGVVRQTAEDLGRPLRGPLDIEVFGDAVERLRLWRAAGGRVIGFDQQGGIALGDIGEDVVLRAAWTVRERAANQLDLVVHCPHHPDATLPDQARCWCRLPKPGMLIAAQQEVALRQHERYPLWMALLVARSPEARQCAEDLGMDHLDGDRWRADGGR